MSTVLTLLSPMKRALGAILIPALLASLFAAPPAQASEAEELVSKSRFTAQRMVADKDFEFMLPYLKEAKGVLIIPQLIKGGFVVGAEGGSGVLMVRGTDGTWSSPAFYTLVAGSLGLQLGGQVSETIFTLMNEGAVEAMLEDEFKLGAGISVAAGPLGAGLEGSSTTNLNADIIAFSKVAGLFGGGAIQGGKIITREELNSDYYVSGATPREIVIDRRFSNAEANKLRDILP